MNPESSTVLRPRDLALLLLATREMLPRTRARDQQADLIGLGLKRRILVRLAALDPEPLDLDDVLLRIVAGLGEPTGPARAVALAVRADWQMACATPAWVAQLLAEAAEEGARG